MRNVMVFVAVLTLAGLVQAQSVPEFVNYQGRLTDGDGAPLATGDYGLRFEVYDDPLDTSPAARVWGPLCFDKETADPLPLPAGHKYKVPVVQGYFNVVLDQETGSGDCATDPPPGGTSITAAFAGAPRYVEIAVDNGSGWEPILPRQHVLSAPYAVSAASATRSTEVVSAEGQPTRIACKTGPTTEIDVVTVGGVPPTVDVDGNLETSGNLHVTGDLTLDGDVTGTLTTPGLSVNGDTIAGLTRTVSKHVVVNTNSGNYVWLAEYSEESLCFLTNLDIWKYGSASNAQARCFVESVPRADDGNTPWWRLGGSFWHDYSGNCDAQCIRWDCGAGTCTDKQLGTAP